MNRPYIHIFEWAVTILATVAVNGQSPPAIGLSQTSVTFAYGDLANPPSQTVTVTNSGGGGPLSVNVTSPAPGSWLTVTPNSGVTPLTLTISPRSGIAGGDLNATVTIEAVAGSGATNSPQTFNVAAYANTPWINGGGIVGAAGYASGTAITAGSIASVFGARFGSTQTATTIPLPYTLPIGSQVGGTYVVVGGQRAPLFYVSEQQINFQVPFENPPGSNPSLCVFSDQVHSQCVTVNVDTLVPGIFTINSSGSGQAAALNMDGTPNSPSNPALAGSTVSLFATGLGPTNPVAKTNQPGGGAGAANIAVTAPIVTFNQVAGNVTFAGLAPGFVGLYQINVTLPSGIASGIVQVVALEPSAVSNTATIIVK